MIANACMHCQDPVCTNGTPSQSPHAEDSPCSTYMTSMTGFCDGMGNCKQCTKASECSGTSPTNDCQQPACTNFACVASFTAVNTPTTTNPPPYPPSGKPTRMGGRNSFCHLRYPAQSAERRTANSDRPPIAAPCGRTRELPVPGDLLCYFARSHRAASLREIELLASPYWAGRRPETESIEVLARAAGAIRGAVEAGAEVSTESVNQTGSPMLFIRSMYC